jgi:hypothetical protein
VPEAAARVRQQHVRPVPRRRAGRVHRQGVRGDGARAPAHVPGADETRRPARDYFTEPLGFSLRRKGRVATIAYQMGTMFDGRTLGKNQRQIDTVNGALKRLETWPLSNVWLGISVEDQKHADARIPLLLQTPAAVRLISAEPLLGPVDMKRFMPKPMFYCAGCGEEKFRLYCSPCGRDLETVTNEIAGLDWVIVGGESGHRARPFDIAWACSIVQQCKAAGVPVFVKQMGTNIRDRNDAGWEGDTPRSWPMDTDYDEDLNGFRGLSGRAGPRPPHQPQGWRAGRVAGGPACAGVPGGRPVISDALVTGDRMGESRTLSRSRSLPMPFQEAFRCPSWWRDAENIRLRREFYGAHKTIAAFHSGVDTAELQRIYREAHGRSRRCVDSAFQLAGGNAEFGERLHYELIGNLPNGSGVLEPVDQIIRFPNVPPQGSEIHRMERARGEREVANEFLQFRDCRFDLAPSMVANCTLPSQCPCCASVEPGHGPSIYCADDGRDDRAPADYENAPARKAVALSDLNQLTHCRRDSMSVRLLGGDQVGMAARRTAGRYTR